MRGRSIPLLAVLAALGTGCASLPAALVRSGPSDPGVRIPGIDVCDHDSPGEVLLDPDRPVILLVHGCYASGGRFRALARVFEAHGQQVLCFNYDDRARIDAAADRFVAALRRLQARLPAGRITVLAHSQGGLVARRAFVRERTDPIRGDGFTYRLLTVSSPFRGIDASADCGKAWLHGVSLGLTVVVCYGISGDKWNEIHPRADLVKHPGTLVDAVEEHVRLATDERGTCRRTRDNGTCAEDDYVFSVDEQVTPRIDADPRVVPVEVAAGHVEIVGTEGIAPDKLLALLQARGILAATPPEERDAIARLLRDLY